MNFKKVFNFCCLFFIVPLFLQAAERPGMPKGWTDGYVYANGIRIHYYRAIPAPGKPVIVMAHGISDNGLCWARLTERLQSQYNIYMLDTRGHGLSDPFTSTDDGETLVKDVVEAVKALKINNPILLGHSMGAATVMRVGAEYPELSKAIIMLDPILRGRTAAPSAPIKTDQPPVARRPPGGMFGSPESQVAQNNKSFSELVASGHQQNPLWDSVDVKYWAVSKMQYHGAYTQEAGMAMTGTMNIGNSLQKIKVPAIILKADASPEVRKSNDEQAKVMPNGKLIHIDGAGHNLHHDKLDQTTQVIKYFLSKL